MSNNGQRFGDSFMAATAVGGAAFAYSLLRHGPPLVANDVLFAFLYGMFCWFSVFGAVYSLYGTVKKWFEEAADRMLERQQHRQTVAASAEPRRPLPQLTAQPPTVADDDDDSEDDAMEFSGGSRIMLVNRLASPGSLLVRYQAEIQAARSAGELAICTINEISKNTSAKKYAPGNPAKELFEELLEAGFINQSKNWTDTGRRYSLPHPTNQ